MVINKIIKLQRFKDFIIIYIDKYTVLLYNNLAKQIEYFLKGIFF